jgi:quercetin dioxygenase-like cupin family protein
MSETYTYIPDITGPVAEIPPDSILSRTFYSDSQVKVILFNFAKGQELSEHTASRPAIIHFLQGEARLRLGKDEFEVHAGAWIHMPPNLTHSVLARTPVTMLLILLEAGE